MKTSMYFFPDQSRLKELQKNEVPTREEALLSYLTVTAVTPWSLYPDGKEIDELDYYFITRGTGNNVPFVSKWEMRCFTLTRIVSMKVASKLTGKSESYLSCLTRRTKRRLSGGFNYIYYSNPKFTLQDNEPLVKKVSL